MTENFEEEWNGMTVEEKNVIVSYYLKTLSKWDLKRIMCDVLDVEHYMDDEGLRKAIESIINVRKTMEKNNWIKAYYASQNDDIEHEVFVKQEESCSEYFVSDKGDRFHISELDLTQNDFEPQMFNLEEFEKRNKEINQQYQESQAMYMEMLSKMDADSIADHKAKIDEREYWRKLRGDIALEIIRKRGDKEHYSQSSGYETIAHMTKILFDELYDQDQEFFKDK